MVDEKDRGISEDRLRRLKAYMRTVGDDDDELITALYRAAVDYLAGAGVTEPKEESRKSRYELVAFCLTLGYYDSRDMAQPANVTENAAFRYLLNQLKADAAIDRAANPQTSADLGVK